MHAILAPENTPFAVALALLALLVLVQLLGFGHHFHHIDFDADAPDSPDLDLGAGLASLIGLGKLPLVVWLSFLLATFALVGLSLQQFVEGIFGEAFSAGAAAGAALLAAVPINGVLAHGLSRIWPGDETTALPVEALVGRRGQITVGKAKRGNPARAAVKDRYGQVHLVMVEPHEDDEVFEQGDEVLLVRRDGETFYALGGKDPLRLGK